MCQPRRSVVRVQVGGGTIEWDSIGAYVAGLSLSGTDVAQEIRERLHGLYEFMVPIFFCVMGMMVDFSAIGGVFVFGLIFSVSAIVGKYLGCGIPSLFCGFNVRGAFRVGSGMLPRGEVTLIIAGIALSAGVIGRDLFGVAVLTLLIATIIAPPLLVKSFDGGPGYRKKDTGKPQLPPTRIVLSFPSFPTADLVRSRITKAFRAEEFFVNRVDRDNPIYQMRKDTIVATCEQVGSDVIVTTDAANERYIRLILSEEVVALKDLFDGLEKTQRDAIGGDLLGGFFDE
ncbi:MAG: cation:proton antiporter [Spirochaetaceae bacterium]|nr:MAG: cation:proton antiporter [Spirochaetaceae bacterium]